MWTTISSAAAVAAVILDVTAAHNNGLARSPQMGWNSWNHFACSVNETIMLTTAKKIKELGLQEHGYHYIVMDDCWSLKDRDKDGNIQYDPKKFPRGIKALADDIHAMGFGWGMYSDAGTYTCAGYAGSLSHEETDAKLFASWGVDYLKYDNCYNEGQKGVEKSYKRYKAMSDALNATGRPILYSMCNWGEDGPWNWAQTIANSWRTTGDITDNIWSVLGILEQSAPLAQKCGPGSWNDLDMLEVGRPGLSLEEQRLHMTLWAVIKSPLIMGHNVLTTTRETLALLTNPAILDISQNNEWSVGLRSYRRGNTQLWINRNNNGSVVATLLNSGASDIVLTVSFDDIFTNNPDARGLTYSATDLWTGERYGEIRIQWTTKVKSHSVTVVRMDPVEANPTKRWNTRRNMSLRGGNVRGSQI